MSRWERGHGRSSPGFFDLDDRLAELSAKGDRPAFDHVQRFKVLILQAMHALSDERTEFLIKYVPRGIEEGRRH